jgi:hypothetical protein
MKWYVSSRTRHRAAVRGLLELLAQHGHEAACDWTRFDQKEVANPRQVSSLALNVSLAIKDCDIFMMIGDDAGTDMYVELGIALAYNAPAGKPLIYVVGSHSERSLMHSHPAIRHESTVANVFRKACPEIPADLVRQYSFS